MKELTQERLKTILSYDIGTGVFRWINATNWRAIAKDAAGCVREKNGYRVIYVGGKLYAAHRLAWLYVTGNWPSGSIDHINGVRDDNRFANLRDVTRSVNNQNLHVANRRNRSCGLLGVTWNRGKWTAQISIPGIGKKNLGRFDDPNNAHSAYLEAKRKYHPGCTI